MRRPQPPSLRQHRRHDDGHGLVDTLKRPTRKDSAQSVIAAECPESIVFSLNKLRGESCPPSKKHDEFDDTGAG